MELREGVRVKVAAPDPYDCFAGCVGKRGTITEHDLKGDEYEFWVILDGNAMETPFTTQELAPLDGAVVEGVVGVADEGRFVFVGGDVVDAAIAPFACKRVRVTVEVVE